METLVENIRDWEGLERRARVFAALSDPNRLRIVELLIDHDEIRGKEAAEALGISLSLYSHHAKALRQAGIVSCRKRGQSVYYSLERDLLDEALNVLNRCPYPLQNTHRACPGCRGSA
jgi:DNA-binding transcriptional ArsR family regulator